MSAPHDLSTQIAVHLFGWRCPGSESGVWRDPDGLVCAAVTFRRRLPAYSRVPDATALVWQWLETHHAPAQWKVTFAYGPETVWCRIDGGPDVERFALENGATSSLALCRAALALAAALERETPHAE